MCNVYLRKIIFTIDVAINGYPLRCSKDPEDATIQVSFDESSELLSSSKNVLQEIEDLTAILQNAHAQ